MDVAKVDKLAKNKKDIKSSLVRQHLFKRKVDANGVKIKDSKGTIEHYQL